MKKIYIVALALIVSAGFATQAFAEQGKGKEGINLSNKIELRGDVKSGINRGEDSDRDDDKKGEDSNGRWGNSDHSPRVFGTVTVVSGNTITITSKSSTNVITTYTIDATNAKIEKNGVKGTIGSILVGDMISVEGTINGTAITAVEIKDGKRNVKSPDFMLQSNGQPIIGGKVTAVNGSIVTVTNKSNVAYTVDITNAKIVKNNKTALVVDVVVGDNILAQGTINGQAVVATTVIDQGNMINNPNGDNGKHKGFFRRFGGWFSSLFGF